MNTVPNGRLYGFYRALVVDAHDPKQTGRVKVHIPDIMLDKGWTGQWCDDGLWAHPANNMLGGRNTYDTKGPRCNHTDAWYQGQCMIPPKGSHVFIMFEKGDPSRPYYWAAADYGQTKVLPENRVGSAYEKKWTLMKTRLGRCMVFSDDEAYDGRVEITGKKRTICKTPDGDTKSVFDIDGNQTVFLIDERSGGHEKVLLKDYRGNFIKMIQDENGINDQLHVFMHDDIHLETPKNIYIKAGENIHITAHKNIYITALQNMYIKVTQNFREMAQVIDRYAEIDDKRFAANNIQDKAGNNIGQDAANSVYQTAISMCGRNCAGAIADMAGGSVSYSGGGTATLTGGGGAFLNGPITGVNNGQSPITPPVGVTQAMPSIKATEPAPDPDRHFVSTDDGWEPVAPDENPQNKCHQKFWKLPQWQSLTPPTQCKNSQVGAGGSGVASGCSSASTSNVDNSANSSNNNVTANTKNIPTQSDTKQSISKNLMDTVKKMENPVIDSGNVVKSISSASKNVKNAVCDTLQTISNKTNVISDKIKQALCDPSNNIANNIKTTMNNLMSAITLEKAKKSMCVVIPKQLKDKICSVESVKTLVNAHKNMFSSILKGMINYTKKNVTDALYNALTTQPSKKYIKRSIYDLGAECGAVISNNITNFINDNIETINSNFDTVCDIFYDVSKSVTEPLVTASNSIYNDCYDVICTTIETTAIDITEDLYDDCFINIQYNIDNFNNYLRYDPQTYSSGMINYTYDLYNNCCNYINKSIPEYNAAVDMCKNNFYGYMNNIDVIPTVENIYTKEFNITYDYCEDVVDNVFKTVTDITSDTITDSVFDILNNDCDNCVANCVNCVVDTVQMFVYDSFKIIDNTLYDLSNIIDNSISGVFDTGIGILDGDICNYCVNNINVRDLPSYAILNNINTLTNDIATRCVDEFYGLMPTGPINSIINNIPHAESLEYYISTSKPIVSKFVDMTLYDVQPINDVVDRVMTGISNVLDSQEYLDTFNKVCHSIPVDNYCINTDYITNYVPVENMDVIDYIVNKSVDSIEQVVSSCVDALGMDKLIPSCNCPSINYSPLYDTLKCGISLGVKNIMENMYSDVSKDFCNFCDKPNCKPCKNIMDKSQEMMTKIVNHQNIIKEKMSKGENVDIQKEMDDYTKKLEDELTNSVNNIDPKESEDCINNTINELTNSCNDTIQPIQDAANNIDNNLYDIISENVGDSLNYNSVDTELLKQKTISDIVDIIVKDLKTEIQKYDSLVPESVINNTSISETDIININKLCEKCNHIITDKITNVNTIKNILTCEKCNHIIQNNIECSGYPTQESQKEKINSAINSALNIVSNEFKDTINKSLILNDINDGNDFNIKVDYTKLYTIPGVPQSKNCRDIYFRCNACEDDSVNLAFNEDRFNPLYIGGCGCNYEYTLYLKNKFYNPIIWIMEKDNIKYTAISINPNIDNISIGDQRLIDNNIIEDHKKIYNHFFKGITTDLENNLYVKRLRNYLEQLEILDFVVVINLMDFECDNYPWLDGVPEKVRYTHDMDHDNLKKYLKFIIDNVYYKLNDKKKIKRNIPVLLNLGNGSYDNKVDVNRELFDVYPNCGFIRDLVMYLTYDCNLTTNFMSISCNDKDNLYYYNPYTEFKSYDDFKQRQLEIYTICTRDMVDGYTNGFDNIITYNVDGSVSGGYFKYLTECHKYSIPLSYIYDLSQWFDKRYNNTNETILQHYTKNMSGDEIDSNIMNSIYTPNYRSVVRYMYNGHKDYFEFEPYKFNKNTGELEG